MQLQLPASVESHPLWAWHGLEKHAPATCVHWCGGTERGDSPPFYYDPPPPPRLAHTPGRAIIWHAVSTAIPAVGAINPFARARVGAIATQAWSNPYLGIDGLSLLVKGLSAAEVLELLLRVDADKERRQLSIVDAYGAVAAFSGDEVQPWKGHRTGKGYVVAGNLLISGETIQAMAEAFETARGPLDERLLLALEAGQATGGDKRGKVSAALLVVRDEEYPYVDLRVDEHAEPVAELRPIFDIYTGLPYLNDLHPRRTWNEL